MSSNSDSNNQPQQGGTGSTPSSSSSSAEPPSLAIRALRYKLSRTPTHELKAMLRTINRLFAMSSKLPDGGNKLRVRRHELMLELGRRQA
ncbi:hypothetical protein GCK32_006044 [Trichostrongylus colubriformis]|uniref:Uncharacterized protein n=1 Tax=Trichostrongylus colubriformis TaxID=6319 RepID=A0AAN8IDW7_TRICO